MKGAAKHTILWPKFVLGSKSLCYGGCAQCFSQAKKDALVTANSSTRIANRYHLSLYSSLYCNCSKIKEQPCWWQSAMLLGLSDTAVHS